MNVKSESEVAQLCRTLRDPMDCITPGVGDGQGGLAYCDSWGGKESDTTEQLI